MYLIEIDPYGNMTLMVDLYICLLDIINLGLFNLLVKKFENFENFENFVQIYLLNIINNIMETFRTNANNIMGYIPKAVTTLMKPIGIFIGTIVSLALIHWILIRTYASYCAPSGWTGPMIALISLGSPVCQFINHFQLGIANYYITIWAAAATGCLVWIASQIGTNPPVPLGTFKQ